MSAENSSGSKSVTITVKVLDAPGPVKNLEVKDVSREHVTLSWEVPETDGGAVTTNFIIERREATRKAWQQAGATPHRTTYKVTGLSEGASYFFR